MEHGVRGSHLRKVPSRGLRRLRTHIIDQISGSNVRQNGRTDRPRSLSEQLTSGEDDRAVHSGRRLSNEDHPVDDERWDDLVDDDGG